MKLRIPTRRHPPDEEEEEHAEQQVRAVQHRAEAQVQAQRLAQVRQVPVKVGPVRLQVREVVYLLRPLTTVPLSFLQCDLSRQRQGQ
jgi:hypothetical protein